MNGLRLQQRVGALEERVRPSGLVCVVAQDGETRGDTLKRLGLAGSSCKVVMLSKLDELI